MMESAKRYMWMGKYLDVVVEGTWEYVERKNHNGIVGIVPVTDDGRLVLVEQYRVPVGKYVIELPAGLVGDEPDARGEQLLPGAQRELLEETGYEADQWEFLFDGVATPGLCDENVHFFRARKLRKVHDGGGVESEDITVHEVPLNELVDWLQQQARAGKAVDLKVYSSLAFAR